MCGCGFGAEMPCWGAVFAPLRYVRPLDDRSKSWMRNCLELFSDRRGQCVLGWLDAQVFLVQLEHDVSGHLGEASAERFLRLLGDNPNVQCFMNVWSCQVLDFAARSAWLRCLLSGRRQLRAILVLVDRGATQVAVELIAGMTGVNYRLTHDPDEFNQQLIRVAPFAWARLDPRTWIAPGMNDMGARSGVMSAQWPVDGGARPMTVNGKGR